MKKVIVAVLVVALLTLGSLVGCLGGITGSGKLETREMDYSDFTKLNVGYAFEVEIIQSASYSVSITADDNLFKYIQISKSGETLKIRLKTGSYISTTRKARITMPKLYGLDLSGATQGAVSGFSSSEDFELELSGASTLDMSGMSAGDITFDIFGASRVSGDIIASDADFVVYEASTVQLQGSASDIVINASGASRTELAAFPVNNAIVNLSGASTGTVNLDGRLDVDLSTGSHLDYIGQPTLGTIYILTGSTISSQ